MSARGPGTAVLLERDAELRLIEHVLERAEGGNGGVVLVDAQAGVGKTELLRAAGSLAEAARLRVLRGRGSELDRPFGFGVVRQLLERCVRESPDVLSGGAEAAAAVFSAAQGASPPEDGLFAHLHALYWLTVNLSASEPLVLLADDLHWADAASLRWLVFLAERVEDLPLMLPSAARPSEPGADQALLDVLASRAHVVRPAPLTQRAAAVLVRDRLPAGVDEFATACHAATGGNAFLLGELLTELTAAGMAGTGAEAARVLEFGSERVGQAVPRRLRLLSEEATVVARAVAVLGPPAPLGDVAALSDLDRDAVGSAVEALVAVGVLGADGDVAFDFVHPVPSGGVAYEQEIVEVLGVEADQVIAAAASVVRIEGLPPCIGRFWTVH